MLVEHQTHNQKVVSSNSGRGSGRIFFSRVNFARRLLLGVRSTHAASILQWHVKGASHSPKSAGGRLHLNMYTPLTHQSQSGLTMSLYRHTVGTYQEMNSHASRQGTLNHSCLSSLSHHGLISCKEGNYCRGANLHLKKREKSNGGE